MKESIGALWLRKSQKGMTYLSGSIEIAGRKQEIVIFKNDKGNNEKRPDYRIFPSERNDGMHEPLPERKPEPVAPPKQQPTIGGGFDDDVPF